nr:transframe fusion protein [Barmah Forest virus]
DTLDDFSYLWTNNQAMFWLQLASPVAAFLCLSYCCRNLACCMKIFLRDKRPVCNCHAGLRALNHDAESGGNTV